MFGRKHRTITAQSTQIEHLREAIEVIAVLALEGDPTSIGVIKAIALSEDPETTLDDCIYRLEFARTKA